MRTATIKDLTVGTKLHNEYGAWTVQSHYDDGIWEIRSADCRNEIVLFESEVHFYQVEGEAA